MSDVLAGAIRSGVLASRRHRAIVQRALSAAEEEADNLRTNLNRHIDETAEWEYEAEQAGIDLSAYTMDGDPLAGPSGNKITTTTTTTGHAQ